MTHTVYIVDSDAKGLAESLNGIARREGHPVKYVAAVSPDRLFEEMKKQPARLILLHHNWTGLTISQLLSRIKSTTSDVRVVVFTGREPNMPELIECVRFGVCDYWLKSGGADVTSWSRKISLYCDSDSYTLEVLGRTSGSVIGLLKEAESNSGRVKLLEAQLSKLDKELQQKNSETSRQMRTSINRGIEYTVLIVVLAAVFIVLASYTSERSAGVLVVVFMLFFLFLQGRIADALIDWRRGKVRVGANAGSSGESIKS